MSASPCLEPVVSQTSPSSERKLVVLDARVVDLPALRDDAGANSDVLVLNSERDGVAQIADYLESGDRVSSLHLVAHGSAASLQLGSTHLNIRTFDLHADSLQRWARMLDGADLLVYGCEVAAGSMGQLFLQQLHQFTGANIAASTQVVGKTDAGSNWTLDARIGNVASAIAFSSQLQQSYSGHFIEVGISDENDFVIEGGGANGNGIYTINFTISEAPPESGIAVLIRTNLPNALFGEFNAVAAALGQQGGGIQGLRGIPQLVNAFDTIVGLDGQVNGALPPGGPPFSAQIRLPLVDDAQVEGVEQLTVELLPVPVAQQPAFPGSELVTIDPTQNTTSVLLVDDASLVPTITSAATASAGLVLCNAG
ncbi:MAG: DUF4347 domain-containing protein, partial [Cyanobacteria bacterium J06639_1]